MCIRDSIEASGNEHVINEGLHTLLRGARMFMVGNPHGDITIKDPKRYITLGETTIKGNWGRSMFWTWDKAEKALLSGKVNLEHIITHRFPLEKFEEAFEIALSGRGCKVLLIP